MDRNDIPLGFGFSLAQDPETMKKFSALPRDKQARILKTAHETASKEGMDTLIKEFTVQ